MQTIYLDANTEFDSLNVWERKNQNRYGTMYGISPKLDLVTTEIVGDYYIFRSEQNNKLFLSINNDGQVGNALINLQAALNKSKGFNFNKSKDRLYIKINERQIADIPIHHNLKVSVNVYGVFVQSATGTAFLQCELSGFNAMPRIQFTADKTVSNADAIDENMPRIQFTADKTVSNAAADAVDENAVFP